MGDPSSPCPVPLDRSVAALRAEGAALDPIVAAITPDRWDAPTRLPRWNVGQLSAHLRRGVERIDAYLRSPVPPAPTLTWLDYWRRVREDSDPEGIARRSVDEARTLDPASFPADWSGAWRAAADEAEAVGADRVMPVPFGAMRLDHYLTTRLVEVVVHGLDLRAALDLEQVATPLGVAVVAHVCDGLLGGPRPVRLERDDVAFVLAATGRIPADDPDLPLFT